MSFPGYVAHRWKRAECEHVRKKGKEKKTSEVDSFRHTEITKNTTHLKMAM
jgi:hypothetical protein